MKKPKNRNDLTFKKSLYDLMGVLLGFSLIFLTFMLGGALVGNLFIFTPLIIICVLGVYLRD